MRPCAVVRVTKGLLVRKQVVCTSFHLLVLLPSVDRDRDRAKGPGHGHQ
jgi:hypothetical protein